MPDISGKRLAVYTLAAFGGGVALLALILAAIRTAPGDDDQPPIIVRDGSIIFEGGDALNPKKGQDTWVRLNSDQHWKAIKNGGHHVASFTVQIEGVADPTNCSATTMAGDSVEIDFDTDSASGTYAYHVTHTDDGGRHDSAQVDADDSSGLTAVSMSRPTAGPSAPPQLFAGTSKKGWISKVGVPNTQAGSVICAISKPADDSYRGLVRVTITPERK